MSSTWGNSWLSSWGVSWDGAELPPNPPATSTSGGAVIVDLPKKKRKARKKRDEDIHKPKAESPREITEEEAKGMAAIYGTPFRDVVAEPIAEEIQEEATISQEFEEIIAKSAILEPAIAAPIEPEVQEIDEIQEEEDDIALILAIIEAIG